MKLSKRNLFRELFESFFAFWFLFITLTNQAKASTAYPDSLLFLETISSADLFDSLCRQTLSIPEKNFNYSNPYGYSYDSIPIFPDSVYIARLEKINTLSPFNFAFNEEVRNYILFFSGKRQGLISRALVKADYYFPIFEEMLDKYNLPIELKYLSIVESALNPNAKSRAGAVGLWQFMPGTGRLYGLVYNSTLDERRDVWQSTEAACRHFADLYAIYHDWNLVLAAYNAGPGNVNKAIKRSNGLSSYWEIYDFLPRETRGYVPAFIAINYVMTYHIHHNIYASDDDLMEFSSQSLDTICINKKLSFSEIALMASVDISTVSDLNPQYSKKYVPATSENPMTVTLPLPAIANFIRYRIDILALETRD